MSFISRQPNGLLCRFSTVTDTITDYNMTDEEYIEMCAQKAREEARETLKHSLRPFERVKESFRDSEINGNRSSQIKESRCKMDVAAFFFFNAICFTQI